MKTPNFQKSGLKTINFIMLFVVITFGCNKVNLEKQNSQSNDEITPIEGKFKKEITVTDNSKTNDLKFTFEIQSNNQEVLKQFSNDAISLDVNVNNCVNSEDNINEKEINLSNYKSSKSEFVLIKLITVRSSIQINNYSVEFSQKVNEYMRMKNIIYVIDLSAPEKEIYPKGLYYSIQCCKALYLVNNNPYNTIGYKPGLNIKLYWGSSCTSGYSLVDGFNISSYTTRSVCYYGGSSKYWRQVWVDGNLKYTRYSTCY